MARVISVRITNEIEKLIDEVIKIKGPRSKSEIIREALEIGLRKMVEEERRREEIKGLLRRMLSKREFLRSREGLSSKLEVAGDELY